jgi:catechol 2,3-dioxygenase-like lactoylglutathione lyase family enzyme
MFERDRVRGLRYPSFYLADFAAAVRFYTAVFGEPEVGEETLAGWKLGDTWLTLFPKGGTEEGANPRNAEFAVEVAEPADVNRLYEALRAAGAAEGWAPRDAEMYVPMRFAYVDDPFGIRIDIICPLP